MSPPLPPKGLGGTSKRARRALSFRFRNPEPAERGERLSLTDCEAPRLSRQLLLSDAAFSRGVTQ